MFEIVKMTHVCRYWRSSLISCPHLWSSIFVKLDHKNFVATCLKRSLGVPLTVRLDLNHGKYYHYPGCFRIRSEWLPAARKGEEDPCRYHTTIRPLLKAIHTRRTRKLDVYLTVVDDVSEDDPDQNFEDALDDFGLFAPPLPVLENLNFYVEHEFDIDSHLVLPENLFRWGFTHLLRHLALRGCFGGGIHVVCKLTSFELVGFVFASEPIGLDQDTFLPFIPGSPCLVSLCLAHCRFPDRAWLSGGTPVKLPVPPADGCIWITWFPWHRLPRRQTAILAPNLDSEAARSCRL